MIKFTPTELKIIFDEIQFAIGHANGELSLYESIEQKIAIELNIGVEDHEKI